jgi:hypothetical protein
MWYQGQIETELIGRSREFPAWGSALGLVTLGFLSATMGLQVSNYDSMIRLS